MYVCVYVYNLELIVLMKFKYYNKPHDKARRNHSQFYEVVKSPLLIF